MKKLNIIFTRDFNLWVNQFTTDQYHKQFLKVWGRSLRNQIITGDGRVSCWCRFPDDVEQLKNYMARKSLKSNCFQLSEHEDFRRNIRELRKLMSQPISRIKDNRAHLKKLTEMFGYKFTYNALALYLPGLWKNDFLKNHSNEKKKALEMIQWALETRNLCEGIHKEVGDHMRKWLGPLLVKHGYPRNYVKLLTVKETKKFVDSGQLPSKKVLEKRGRGFVYMKGKLYTTSNLKKFFADRGIELVEEKFDPNTSEFKGTCAYPGKPVKGKVRVALNSEEAKKHKKGEILVSSMTAPDYLPAMRNSRAIITDEGGTLCHAAIVSRELKIPCVIGTRIATKLLKDGDRVEVDANKGVVKIFKKA